MTCEFPARAAVVTAAVLMCAVGCTNQITGTATQDPTQPPLALSDDGYGIVAGYPDAPVQIELTPNRSAATAKNCSRPSATTSSTTSTSASLR